MEFEKVVSIIRNEYAETVQALNEAEKEYLKDKRKTKNRMIFEFCAAQEMELSNLCSLLGIELYNEDFSIII